jgi:chemotaxis protein methyltransferase CheR
VSTAPITHAQQILTALLESRAGHHLSADRLWRIDIVLQPVMRRHGIATLDALVVALIDATDRDLLDAVIDALINHETYFFRDPQAFDVIDRQVLIDLRAKRSAQRRLSIWSVGCSTGQEPYSLAMLIAQQVGRWIGWHIDIWATDISATSIAAAKSGQFNAFEIARGLPDASKQRWFNSLGSTWQISQTLRQKIRFAEHNLLVDPLPEAPVDFILCRNLLFYLTPGYRAHALSRLADALSPDGLIMFGAFETILTEQSRLVPHPDIRGAYRRLG